MKDKEGRTEHGAESLAAVEVERVGRGPCLLGHQTKDTHGGEKGGEGVGHVWQAQGLQDQAEEEGAAGEDAAVGQGAVQADEEGGELDQEDRGIEQPGGGACGGGGRLGEEGTGRSANAWRDIHISSLNLPSGWGTQIMAK